MVLLKIEASKGKNLEGVKGRVKVTFFILAQNMRCDFTGDNGPSAAQLHTGRRWHLKFQDPMPQGRGLPRVCWKSSQEIGKGLLKGSVK